MSEILNQSAQSLLECPNITFSGFLELKISTLSFHHWKRSFIIILNGNIYIYDNCNSKTPKISEVLAIYEEIHIVQKRKRTPIWCFFLKPKLDKKPKVKFGASSEQEMMSIIEKFKKGMVFSKNISYPKNSQSSNEITFQPNNSNLPTFSYDSVSKHSNILPITPFSSPISPNTSRTQLPLPPMNNDPNIFDSPVLPFGHPTQFPPHPMNNVSHGFSSLPIPNNNPQIPQYQYQPQFPLYPIINNSCEFRNIPNLGYSLPQPPFNNFPCDFNNNLNSLRNSPPPPYESQRPLPTVPDKDSSSRISSNDFIFIGTREDAANELKKFHIIGSYLIRVENERNILTVQTKEGIIKYLLLKDSINKKISIQGQGIHFNSQLELVIFYTLNNIPNYNCKLTIPYKLATNHH